MLPKSSFGSEPLRSVLSPEKGRAMSLSLKAGHQDLHILERSLSARIECTMWVQCSPVRLSWQTCIVTHIVGQSSSTVTGFQTSLPQGGVTAAQGAGQRRFRSKAGQ